MQPVFAYNPQSYPPRGRIWPQWGDDVLEETLSDGARQSLNRKREGMRDFHKENLVYHGLAHPPMANAPMEEDWPDELYDRPRAPPQPPQPGPQPPQAGPQRPGYQPPPSLNRPDLGPGPRRPQTYDIDIDPPEPPPAPDQPMGPAPGMQSFGRPPDAPGGRSRVPRETQSGPDGSMNPDVQITSGDGGLPPGAGAVVQQVPVKPKKGRDGPYQRPSDDLGPPADGIMNVPFPIGPSNPVPIVPVTPTPKAIIRRNRPGPYEQPEEEETLGPPADGVMNLPFPMGPQATAIEEDRAMRSDFAPKRQSETPLAATSKKPANNPQPWPLPPSRNAPEEETLVPQDGTMTVPYPTASSSSSSSSSGPNPPPQKPRKKTASVLAPQSEEVLEPLSGIMELPTRSLSIANQKIW